MFTGSQGIANRLPRSVKVVALAVSLVVSALLTAAALRSPDHHWLAWISFLPLFVAVRWLGCPVPSTCLRATCLRASTHRQTHRQRGEGRNRPAERRRHSSPSPTLRERGVPAAAALAGALWGACLYVFCTAGPTPAVNGMGSAFAPSAPALAPSLLLLALLIVIPAVYVGLAARPARAIGYTLLTLALGWTLVETVLHLHNVFGPHDGLLTASQGEGQYLHWLVRLLAYVSMAFLVACVNASLVGILSGARLSFPAYRSLVESPHAGAWAPSQVVLAIQSWTLRQAHPRAPPILVAVPSWNLVGSAHRSL